MPDFEHLTDAELVAAFRGGDRAAFAGIYDRYAERLYSYCLTMLRSSDVAADATEDAFVEAGERLEILDDPDKLRPWLFAIARSETRAEGRRRSLVIPKSDHAESLVENPDLAIRPKQAELRSLVWAAADSLSERDQQLMAMHLTEGLEGDDLAQAMDVELSHLDGLVSRMRDRVERAMGALLIARLGSQDCDELPDVLGDWDGAVDPDVRSRVTRHIAKCETCQERRAVLLAPAAVLPGIMLVTPPDELRKRVLDQVAPIEEALAAKSGPSDPMMWGVFAVVTVVLGLIGMNVSASFTPLEPGDITVRQVPDVASTTTTSTSTTLPTTSTPATATTAPAADASAALAVVTQAVDYGSDGNRGALEITNNGQAPGSFSVTASAAFLVLAAGEAEVGPGESLQFAVNLDRDSLPEGDIAETVTVAWEGGQAEVAVTGTHIDNPIIHNPQASPSDLAVGGGSACRPTTSTVSARIRDISPFTAVVQWSADGLSTTETAMTDAGNDIWEAEIGPFSAAQPADARIVATDELGNAGGTRITLNVTDCP